MSRYDSDPEYKCMCDVTEVLRHLKNISGYWAVPNEHSARKNWTREGQCSYGQPLRETALVLNVVLPVFALTAHDEGGEDCTRVI